MYGKLSVDLTEHAIGLLTQRVDIRIIDIRRSDGARVDFLVHGLRHLGMQRRTEAGPRNCGLRIIDIDRIHVDDQIHTGLLPDTLFGLVDFLVHSHKVRVARHFGMQRRN